MESADGIIQHEKQKQQHQLFSKVYSAKENQGSDKIVLSTSYVQSQYMTECATCMLTLLCMCNIKSRERRKLWLVKETVINMLLWERDYLLLL